MLMLPAPVFLTRRRVPSLVDTSISSIFIPVEYFLTVVTAIHHVMKRSGISDSCSSHAYILTEKPGVCTF